VRRRPGVIPVLCLTLAAIELSGLWVVASAHGQAPRGASLAGVTPQTAPAPNPAPGTSREAAPARADEPPEAVVTLRDGQRVSGELLEEDGTRIVVIVGGREVMYPRDIVRSVERLPSVSDRYRQVRDTIDPRDADSIVRLAEWLRTRGRLVDALAEVNRALEVDPVHKQGLELRTIVQQQIYLRATRGAPGPSAGADAERPAARPEPARDQVPLLSAEQINLIRVYETDLRDPPRMSVAPGTIASLIESYTGDPLIPASREGKDRLFRAPPGEILDLLFRLRARELYNGVRVLEPPRALRLFRDDVHRGWLLNACATAACHGGAEAGRLRLARSRPSGDATITTNLYILDRYRTVGGESLIDYDTPGSSILVQHGLPVDQASAPHPRVEGWRPAFRGMEDPKLERTLAWIRTMYRPRPDYGIDYRPVAPFAPPDPESPAPETGPSR
jgi:hypothetical protein